MMHRDADVAHERSGSPPSAHASQAAGTNEALADLLSAYLHVSSLVDALPRVIWIPYSRTWLGQKLRIPRLRWRRLLRYFVIDHAQRVSARIARIYATQAALRGGPREHADEFERLETFRHALPSVPIRRLVLASGLLAATLSYSFVPLVLDDRAERLFSQVVSAIPLTLDPTQLVDRLERVAKAVRTAGQNDASDIASSSRLGSADAPRPADGSSPTDASGPFGVVAKVERFDPEDAWVLAQVIFVLWLTIYAVLFVPAHGFRVKRLLFNAYRKDERDVDGAGEELAARLASAVVVEQQMLTTGVYAKEDALCKELGVPPCRELPLDLLGQGMIVGLVAPLVLAALQFSFYPRGLLGSWGSLLLAVASLSAVFVSIVLPSRVLARRRADSPAVRSLLLGVGFGVAVMAASVVALAIASRPYDFAYVLLLLLAGLTMTVLPLARLAWLVRTARRRHRRKAVPSVETQGPVTAVKELLQVTAVLCLLVMLGLWAGQAAWQGWLTVTNCSEEPVKVEQGGMIPLVGAHGGAQSSEGGSGAAPEHAVEGLIRAPCGGILYTMHADGEISRLASERTVMAPLWSPTGDRVALLTEGRLRGRFDLWIMEPGGSSARRVKQGADWETPRWSPDGRRIAFVSEGQIWAADAANPRPTKLTGGGNGLPSSLWDVGSSVSDIEWSPDGRRIAFTSELWKPDALEGALGGGWTISEQIVVVGSDGTGRLELGEGSYPHWAPDGTRLLFVSTEGHLSVVAPNGTGRRQLANAYWGRWSPDGGRVMFLGTPRDASDEELSRAYVAKSDGTEPVPLADGDEIEEMLWSPDGSHVLIRTFDGDALLVDPDGTNRRSIGSRFTSAGWSPDGEWIVLVRDVRRRFGRHAGHVYVTRASEVTPPRRLARIDGSDQAPEVSDVLFAPVDRGYRLASAGGRTWCAGVVACAGSRGVGRQDVVGMAALPTGAGHWLVASDGTVFGFGAARYKGSASEAHEPIVGIASTISGEGYWLAAFDGSVFPFGDAKPLERPPLGPGQRVVGIASTPSGDGYWLVTADGDVLPAGAARFYGSAAGQGASVGGMAPTPSGEGYWLVTIDGTVIPFGDARLYRSHGSAGVQSAISGILPTLSGRGYWLVGSDGNVLAFGDAPDLSGPGVPRDERIVGIGR